MYHEVQRLIREKLSFTAIGKARGHRPKDSKAILPDE